MMQKPKRRKKLQGLIFNHIFHFKSELAIFLSHLYQVDPIFINNSVYYFQRIL